MDKRSGRFVLSGKKTMQLGTEVYTEIVEKMLAVHIAHMERKMKACIQCAPNCAPVLKQRQLRKHPYTAPYNDKQFLPQHMLPTYLIKRLADAQRNTAKGQKQSPLRYRA